MTKKKCKHRLVGAIDHVVMAFAQRLQPPEGKVFKTKCGSLSFDGRLLLYYKAHQPYVVGIHTKAACLLSSRTYGWKGWVKTAADTHCPKARWMFFRYHGADHIEMVNCLYDALASSAQNAGDKTRDQIIVEWTKLCHAIGLGEHVGSPPDNSIVDEDSII